MSIDSPTVIVRIDGDQVALGFPDCTPKLESELVERLRPKLYELTVSPELEVLIKSMAQTYIAMLRETTQIVRTLDNRWDVAGMTRREAWRFLQDIDSGAIRMSRIKDYLPIGTSLIGLRMNLLFRGYWERPTMESLTEEMEALQARMVEIDALMEKVAPSKEKG